MHVLYMHMRLNYYISSIELLGTIQVMFFHRHMWLHAWSHCKHCKHCKLSWGPSLGPNSVKSGSISLCWAVRVMQWQAHDKYREGGEAKAYESEAALHIAFKTSVRHIQRMWCIYPACCLCGWTEQQANQMCYLYGVKPRLCMEYVRNLFDLEFHFDAFM